MRNESKKDFNNKIKIKKILFNREFKEWKNNLLMLIVNRNKMKIFKILMKQTKINQ